MSEAVKIENDTTIHPSEMGLENYSDVLIVGAGISGIGAGCHLRNACPNKSFKIFEGRANFGGTWDLFKYPGIRSDSDMHTLGFNFKPWKHEKSIADGPAIMDYLQETIKDYQLDEAISYNHWVTGCNWDSSKNCWVVTVKPNGKNSDEIETHHTNFLMMCAGYYSYDDPYQAHFEGKENFKGDILHPQFWPEDYDYSGKKAIVIGSGATAVTVVPSMAEKAAHVTMLQRSPTYIASRPAKDGIANFLRKVLPQDMAYDLTRLKNTTMQSYVYNRAMKKPEKIRDFILKQAKKELPDDYVDQHLTPNYDPWTQRLCMVPDGDLFQAIRDERAAIVTDHIDHFTENGIQLKSGEHLDADIIVTATGLSLEVLGGIQCTIDGQDLPLSDTWTYKGVMYSDIPNMATSFGYVNASWTLRADLYSEYMCRLLNHMDNVGAVKCTPRLRDSDSDMEKRDWIQNFDSGYMERGKHLMPVQGDREPWLNPQNYRKDKKLFKNAALDDGCMIFE